MSRLHTVDPAYTSRTCSACGHCAKANRKSQASFVCKQCGFADNADRNAAINISRAAVIAAYCRRTRLVTSPRLEPVGFHDVFLCRMEAIADVVALVILRVRRCRAIQFLEFFV